MESPPPTSKLNVRLGEYWQDSMQRPDTCSLCRGTHVVCPGCSGFSLTYPELFMGCGVEIRCPECQGYDTAWRDKQFMERHYWDDKLKQAYYDKMFKELRQKVTSIK